MSLHFSFKISLVLLFSATLFSCTKFNNGSEFLGVDEVRAPEIHKQSLIAVGYASISAQKGGSFDLQMLNAIKVSKLEAYKEMAEQLHGVLVSAENNIDGARLQDDFIRSRVKGLVRGAKVLRSYHEGDVYITELEIDLQSSPFL